MAEDPEGLSPSELMLRAARGDGDDAAQADLDFELPGNDADSVDSLEYTTEFEGDAMSAEDIAAALASKKDQTDIETEVQESAPPARPVHQEPVVTPAESVEPVQAPPADAPSDPWNEPSDEWMAREAARPKRRRSVLAGSTSWIRIAISVAVFGFIAVGFIGAQLDGKEPVENLAVGDCFVAGQVEEIDQVPVVDCSEPHDSEVMASVEITGFSSQYPGEDPLFDALFDDCVTKFPSYVGEPFETSQYYIDTWIPLLDGWNDGDRTGLCTVVQVDDSFDIVSVTGSAQNSPSNA
jgi:hypothetical protein